MIQKQFEGFYKGGRDYLHGTDLFNQAEIIVREKFGTKSFVQNLVIRSVARNSGAYFINYEKVPVGYTETAHIKIFNGSETIKGCFATNEGLVIESRDYDEDLVMQKAIIEADKQQIKQVEKTNYSSCEEIVALNKNLNNYILPPQTGKWMFTMLDLNGPYLRMNKELFTIRIKQNLGGKMTKSEILVGDQQIGTIGFAVL